MARRKDKQAVDLYTYISKNRPLRAWVTERGDDVEFLVTIKETDGDVFRTDPKNPTAKLLHNNLIKIKPLEEEKDAIS